MPGGKEASKNPLSGAKKVPACDWDDRTLANFVQIAQESPELIPKDTYPEGRIKGLLRAAKARGLCDK